ncbi:Hypothetical protein SCLAV_2444 [Streptomyces clavuligerus]|uniref:Uncharacterized protein n=1 Tax=Streptomyces clavuligerus TaxID=1901 RepID=E2Q8M9_STRCL|nr:Hypothetical protein SCLAV_2444 [Streptomyces clavuligerus]
MGGPRRSVRRNGRARGALSSRRDAHLSTAGLRQGRDGHVRWSVLVPRVRPRCVSPRSGGGSGPAR